ncbi:putative 5'-3' exoribonuclease 2 [Nannochloris sp. 'desiccata']|nr:putative 5'-3' exoribonuclease 2 [Chlorella desiccata (nom. nud.)]
MGIPGFASWLRERYPEAFCELGPNNSFDNIYIDLQSTLHMVTRKSRNRHGFHLLLHRRLDTLLSTLSPNERVVLAMDGPAPLAKLLEQRRRRRRESDRSENAEKEGIAAANEAAATAAGARGGDATPLRSSNSASRNAVSPLFLTTGTVFMLEVHNSLVYYICQRLTDPRFKHLHFELSDSTVKGEGELKILSRLLHSAAEENNGNTSEQTHAVVGGDSDLLVMAIASGQRHVMLWDDVPNRRHRSSSAFNRDKLEALWRKTHLSEGATQTDIANLGLDLALLAIISSGNDYLPGCQGLGLQNKGRPGLWSLYLDMRKQPEWKDRSLISRVCDEGCGAGGDSSNTGEKETKDNTLNSYHRGDGGVEMNTDKYEGSKVCPGGVYVSIDRPVLAALLRRYTDQRFAVGDGSSGSGAGGGGGSFSGVKQISGAWNFAMKKKSGKGGGNGATVSTTSTTSSTTTTTTGTANDGTSTAMPESLYSTGSAPGSPIAGMNNMRDQTLYHPWRPPADVEAYIEGLEWVLTMYGTGAVSDYRFSYPGAPPTIPSFIEALEGININSSDSRSEVEGAEGEADGLSQDPSDSSAAFTSSSSGDEEEQQTSLGVPSKQQHARIKSSRAGLQPLIPAACALALLPARSRRQAATPLRHLMDADSPVAEIYAVCKECQALSTEVRSVSAQMDEVRTKLASLQHKLGSAAPDADGVHDVEGDLAAASEVFEAAQDKLKVLLRDLSRSQQEHFKEKHPFKPFPTDLLEAAVTAVREDQYPPRERRLARFGREMVFRSGEYTASGSFSAMSSIDGDEEEQEQQYTSQAAAAVGSNSIVGDTNTRNKPKNYNNSTNSNNSSLLETNLYLGLPGWLKDASRFAAAYPRIGSQEIVLGASYGVVREVLPLHPYMQPGLARARTGGGNAGGGRGGNTAARPSAMYMACQVRRYTSGTNSTMRVLDLTSTVVGGIHNSTNMWGRSLKWRTGSGFGSGSLTPSSFFTAGLSSSTPACGAYAGGVRVVSLQQRGNSRLMQAALKTCARVLPRLRALC